MTETKSKADSAGAEQDRELPLLEHLVELRGRLIKALVAVFVVFAALVPVANHLYEWFAVPVMKSLPKGSTMIATQVVSPFLIPVKLALFTAVLIALPVVLYQAWAFIAPGLYKREKKVALPVLVSSTLLFYLGGVFAYVVVIPGVFAFTTAFAPEAVAVMPDIGAYLDFVLVVILAFGLCFEVPVIVVLLVMFGFVELKTLQETRGYAIIAAFGIAAVITPPDPTSMILMAVPMCVLYEIGLLVARVVVNKRAAELDPV
jgi:sec-independent protein translocase protein TatC